VPIQAQPSQPVVGDSTSLLRLMEIERTPTAAATRMALAQVPSRRRVALATANLPTPNHREAMLASRLRRGEERAELNCKCNPAAPRRKPAATAAGGGVMQLQLRYIPKPGVDVVGRG